MSVFLIAAGGTGGHLSPGIAVAQALRARGHSCALIVSGKRVDARLLEKYPELEFVRISGGGFRWGLWATPRFAFGQARALWQAWRLVGRKRPAAVIGFGGFTTVGLALAARLRGVPVFLHEANRVVGRAIRFLSGIADCVYVPEGVPLRGLPPRRARECAFPLRAEMRKLPRAEARMRLGLACDGKLLLVLGGSQGASGFNDWVASNFNRLAAEGISVYCVMGLGKGGRGVVEKRNADGEVARATFTNFCDDMPALLSAADLVLSRAGAGSLAEYARFRLPAILVPYPFAADDHQRENARFFERRGAAVVVEQAQRDRLFREIIDVIFNEGMLDALRANLKRIDEGDAAQKIADDLIAAAHS